MAATGVAPASGTRRPKRGMSEQRKDRVERFGIDCGDGLLWKGGSWRPGGEYIKKLQVKNVGAAVQTIRYALPASKFFSMDFPEPRKLAPGNSASIEIRFRPVREEEYEDEIEFETPAGRFSVPVVARLPRLGASLPPQVMFPLSPALETASSIVLLSNTGQVPFRFEFRCAAPFLIEPSSGVAPPGEDIPIRIDFTPPEAGDVETTATCLVQAVGESAEEAGEGGAAAGDAGAGHGGAGSVATGGVRVSGPSSLQMSTVLRGTGKFPHIVVEPREADFGEVTATGGVTSAAGAGAEVTDAALVLRNPSQVHCTVVSRPVEQDRRPHFSLVPGRAVVDGDGGNVPLKLSYRPVVPGSHSVERFQLTAPGGARVTVVARGRAVAPRVTLGRKDREGAAGGRPGKRKPRPSVLDFGDFSTDKAPPSHVLRLRNHSAAPVRFAFLAEEGAVFRFSKLQGEIPAQMYLDVSVHFVPQQSGNFSRRIPCLIRGGEPLWVDCIGTAHDPSAEGGQRPMPLRDWHYRAYRMRPAPLRLLAPDDVLAVAKAHARAVATGLDPEQALPRAGFPSALTSAHTRAWEESTMLRPGGGADVPQGEGEGSGLAEETITGGSGGLTGASNGGAGPVLTKQTLSALELAGGGALHGGGASQGAPRTPMLRGGGSAAGGAALFLTEGGPMGGGAGGSGTGRLRLTAGADADEANLQGMALVRASGRAGRAASTAGPEVQATRCESMSLGARAAYAEIFASAAAVTQEPMPVASLGPAHDPPLPVTLSAGSLDFGAAGHGRMPPKRHVMVRNHTNGRVAIFWHVPKTAEAASRSISGALAREGSDWAVVPRELDLAPGQEEEVTISFRPRGEDAYYGSELECVALPRQNRSFRLVDESSFCPAVTIPLRVSGHSFASMGSFQPRASLQGPVRRLGDDEAREAAYGGDDGGGGAGAAAAAGLEVPDTFELGFPPVFDAWRAADMARAAGRPAEHPCAAPDGKSLSGRWGPSAECGYQTVELRNESDAPCAFSIPDDPQGVFAVLPAMGHVPAKGFALLAVRYRPPPVTSGHGVTSGKGKGEGLGEDEDGPRRHVAVMPIELNGSESSGLRLVLRGSAALPRLALPAGGVVFGRPTCVGAQSVVTARLASAARVPCRFRWRIPKSAEGVLSLFPEEGRVSGNDHVDVQVCFSPRRAGRHEVVAECLVYPSGGQGMVAMGAGPEEVPPCAAFGVVPGAPRNEDGSAAAGGSQSAVQRLLMTFVCEGAEGALAIVPSRLDAGAVRVGAAQRVQVELRNRSTSALRWRVAAVLDGPAAAGLREWSPDGDPESNLVEESKTSGGRGSPTLGGMGGGGPGLEVGSRYALSLPGGRRGRNGTVGTRSVMGGAMDDEEDWVAREQGAEMALALVAAARSGNKGARLALAWLRAGRDARADDEAYEESVQREEAQAGLDAAEAEAARRRFSRGDVKEQERGAGGGAGAPGFDPETGLPTGGSPPLSARSSVSRSSAGVSTVREINDEDQLDDGPLPEPVSLAPFGGDLAAKSHRGLELVVAPRARGPVRAYVYAIVETVQAALHGGAGDIGGGNGLAPATEMSMTLAQALARRGRRARVLARAAGLALGTLLCPPPLAPNADGMALEIRGQGIVPSVCVEDARCLQSHEALLYLFPHFDADGRAGQPSRHAAAADAAEQARDSDSESKDGGGLGPDGLPRAPRRVVPLSALVPSRGRGRPGQGAGVFGDPAAAATVRRGGFQRAEDDEDGDAHAASLSGWCFDLGQPLLLPGEQRQDVAKRVGLRWAAAEATAVARGKAAPLAPLAAVPTSSVCSPAALWRRLSLHHLNSVLAGVMLGSELRYLKRTPMFRDARDLRRTTIEFAPRPVGAPPEVILLSVRNCGGVECSMKTRFLARPEAPAEPWTEMRAPSTEERRCRDLNRRGVMAVFPRSARLQPGQRATLRMHYAYEDSESIVRAVVPAGKEAAGVGGKGAKGKARAAAAAAARARHLAPGTQEAEVLMQVEGGKVVRMLLRGRTLRRGFPFLYPSCPSGLWRLRPVMVGSQAPPLQFVNLHNTSDTDAFYAIDPAPFWSAAAATDGLPPFSVPLEGRRGFVPAGGEVAIPVVANPTEAGESSCEMRVRWTFGDRGHPFCRVLEGRLGLGGSPCADEVSGAEGEEGEVGESHSSHNGPSWGEDLDDLPPSVEAGGRRWKEAHGALVTRVMRERKEALGLDAGNVAVPRPGPLLPSGASSVLGNEWDVSVRLLCRGYLSPDASLGGTSASSESKQDSNDAESGAGQASAAAQPAIREDPSPAPVLPGLQSWSQLDRALGWQLAGTDVTAELAAEAAIRKASVAAAEGRAGTTRKALAAAPASGTAALEGKLSSHLLGGAIGAALRRADSRVRGLEVGSPEDGPMSVRHAAEMAVGQAGPAAATSSAGSMKKAMDPESEETLQAQGHLTRVRALLHACSLEAPPLEGGKNGAIGQQMVGPERSVESALESMQSRSPREQGGGGGGGDGGNDPAVGSSFPQGTMVPYAPLDAPDAHVPPSHRDSPDSPAPSLALVPRRAVPMVPAPGALSADFFGAEPPLVRCAAWPAPWCPEGMASLSAEEVPLGDLPFGGAAHRLVVLRNHRKGGVARSKELGWVPPDQRRDGSGDGGSAGAAHSPPGPVEDGGWLRFAWESTPALTLGGGEGSVSVHPSSGMIPPGGAVLCRVTCVGPYAAVATDGYLSCVAAVPEEEVAKLVAVRAREQAVLARRRAAREAARPPDPKHVPVATRTTQARELRVAASAHHRDLKATSRARKHIAPPKSPSVVSRERSRARDSRRASDAGSFAAPRSFAEPIEEEDSLDSIGFAAGIEGGSSNDDGGFGDGASSSSASRMRGGSRRSRGGGGAGGINTPRHPGGAGGGNGSVASGQSQALADLERTGRPVRNSVPSAPVAQTLKLPANRKRARPRVVVRGGVATIDEDALAREDEEAPAEDAGDVRARLAVAAAREAAGLDGSNGGDPEDEDEDEDEDQVPPGARRSPHVAVAIARSRASGSRGKRTRGGASEGGRSKLSMGLPASAIGQRAPQSLAVPPPVPPAVRLMLRVRARVLSPDDFDAVHGASRRACFVTVHGEAAAAGDSGDGAVEHMPTAPRIGDLPGGARAQVPPSADALARQHVHGLLMAPGRGGQSGGGMGSTGTSIGGESAGSGQSGSGGGTVAVDEEDLRQARGEAAAEAAAESRGSTGGLLGVLARDLMEMLAADAAGSADVRGADSGGATGATFAEVSAEMRAPIPGDASGKGHLEGASHDGGDAHAADPIPGGCEDRAWAMCQPEGRALCAGVVENALRLVIGDAMGSAEGAGAFLAEGEEMGDAAVNEGVGGGYRPLASRAVLLDG